MSYNTIVVHLEPSSPVAPRLNFAIDVAGRFEADVIALAVGEVPLVVPNEGDGMASMRAYQRRLEQLDERLAALRTEFLDLAGDREHVRLETATGDPTALLATHARSADLLIAGSGAVRSDPDINTTVDLGALILSAGRPILVPSGDAALRAETIVVAWTDTREARRAIADALPFLKQADEVLVTTIADGDREHAQNSAAEVVRYLMRHGVKARAEVRGRAQASIEGAIAGLAREARADLVVAGGYGHSRLREWAFGGTTRSLLADRSLNRFFSN